MNPVALFVMVGFLAAWLLLAIGAALYGHPGALAIFAVVTVALYLYTPWARLQAAPLDRTGRPARFWINGALIAVALAVCGLLGWMMAVRLGLA
jgi:hypothetical protein